MNEEKPKPQFSEKLGFSDIVLNQYVKVLAQSEALGELDRNAITTFRIGITELDQLVRLIAGKEYKEFINGSRPNHSEGRLGYIGIKKEIENNSDLISGNREDRLKFCFLLLKWLDKIVGQFPALGLVERAKDETYKDYSG